MTEQEDSTNFGADDAKVAKEATPEVPPLLVLDESVLQFH
jgi:isoleucyl-tRNA synthetase